MEAVLDNTRFRDWKRRRQTSMLSTCVILPFRSSKELEKILQEETGNQE